MGDLFGEDDAVGLWILTVAIAFNDITFTNVQHDAADAEWKRFYWWRLSVGHYNEVMLYLEHQSAEPEIVAFVEGASPAVGETYDEALQLYDESRALTNRIRNETIFHYPKRTGIEALRRAVREISDERGGATSGSGKIKDMRLHFADEAVARMVMNASGGDTEEHLGQVWEQLGRAVAAFMKFANHAQDEFFMQRLA